MASLTNKQAIALAEKYKHMPELDPLVLPVPTSKNRLRKVIKIKKKTVQTFSDDYKTFKQSARIDFAIWKSKNPKFEAFQGQRSRLILSIKYEVIDPDHRCDLANRSEALLDALKGLAWEDDAYINLTRHIPSNPAQTANSSNPRAIVYLNPYQISVIQS